MNEQYKTAQIINTINASIYWKHNNDYYLGCNKYVLGMFGMSDHSQFIGKTIYDILPQTDADQIQQTDQSVLDGCDFQGEEQLTVATGEIRYYWSSKVRLFDIAGNVIGLVGASLDITDRKKAEQLKLENEANIYKAAIAEKEKLIAEENYKRAFAEKERLIADKKKVAAERKAEQLQLNTIQQEAKRLQLEQENQKYALLRQQEEKFKKIVQKVRMTCAHH